MIEECCPDCTFQLIEELGKVESIEWDLGRCAACGSFLMRSWCVHPPHHGYRDKISDDQAHGFQNSSGRERLQMLKDWLDES